MLKFRFVAVFLEHVVDCEIFAVDEKTAFNDAVKYIDDNRYKIELIN